jgi:glucan phosphorylase
MPIAKQRYDLHSNLIREIAREMGTSFEEIYSVVNTQSKYTVHVMTSSGFETVMLPYLGKFLVKPYRLYKLNENRAQRRFKAESESKLNSKEGNESV